MITKMIKEKKILEKKKNKIFIYYLGCPRRGLDAKKIQTYFQKNNYELVFKPEDANIIFFITCALSNNMAEVSFNKIEEFQKYDAEVIVGGCLPGIEKEKLNLLFHGKKINTKDIDEIDNYFPDNKIKFKDIEDTHEVFINTIENKSLYSIKKNSKIKDFLLKKFIGKYSFVYNTFLKNKDGYYIRIGWGCLGKCSYCKIRDGIGKLKDKTFYKCIKEIKDGINKGNKYFVIEADDTGAYGFNTENNITKILDEITKLPGDFLISINNFHPVWLVKYVDELEEILKRKKIISMTIPIQSGSSRILRLMQRYSNVEKMKKTIIRLQKIHPNLKIATHFIIGFPTENEEDFQKTLDLIKELNLSVGICFKFSCRKGTPAEKIEPKISPNIILKRYNRFKKFVKKEGFKAMLYPKKNALIFEKNNFYIDCVEYLK